MSIVFRRRAAYPRRHVDRRGDQAVRARSGGAPLPLPVLRPGAGRAAGGLRPGDRVLAGDPLRRHRRASPGTPRPSRRSCRPGRCSPASRPVRCRPCWPTSPSWPRGSSGCAAVRGCCCRQTRPTTCASASWSTGPSPRRRSRPSSPGSREVAKQLVDGFAPRGRAELVHDYGVLLPLTIIAECLGVADDELPQFKRWSDDFVAAHRQPRHRTRPAALAPAVAERVLRVLRREDRRAAGAAEARPDLRPRRGHGSTTSPCATTRSWPCSTSSSWPATRPPRS